METREITGNRCFDLGRCWFVIETTRKGMRTAEQGINHQKSICYKNPDSCALNTGEVDKLRYLNVLLK